MAEVFEWYILAVVETIEDLASEFPMPSPYAWLTIRHVCQSWRRVALGFPRLNAYISLHRWPECAKELLKRSGSSPLHILDPWPRYSDEESAMEI